MTWLPSYSIASTIEQIVVTTCLCLAICCLIPVIAFVCIDISLFIFKICIHNSSQTYISVKRRLSDPNVVSRFNSFTSLSTLSAAKKSPSTFFYNYHHLISPSRSTLKLSSLSSAYSSSTSLFKLNIFDSPTTQTSSSDSVVNQKINNLARRVLSIQPILASLANYISSSTTTSKSPETCEKTNISESSINPNSDPTNSNTMITTTSTTATLSKDKPPTIDLVTRDSDEDSDEDNDNYLWLENLTPTTSISTNSTRPNSSTSLNNIRESNLIKRSIMT